MRDYIPSIQHKQPVPVKAYRLKGKFLGALYSDLTFRRTVRLSKHLYRELDGFGVDKWLLFELKRENCLFLEFTEKEEDKEYIISLREFLKRGRMIDHGYGVQVVCPRKFWKVIEQEKQLSLWG